MTKFTTEQFSKGNVWRLRAVMDAFPRVRTFEDLDKPFVMLVKPEHIVKAVRGSPQHCAFACAAPDAGFDGAYIARTVAYFIRGSRAIRGHPSMKAFAEIRAFDIAGKFEPSAYSFAPFEKGKRFGASKTTHRAMMVKPKPTREVSVQAKNNYMRKDKPADYVRVFGR